MKPKLSRIPTLEEIQKLTAFLPILYAPGFNPIEKWEGGNQVDGTISLPYPKYTPKVKEFFRVASQEQWLDYVYSPDNALHKIESQNFIQFASLLDLKSMITFCVRGERFCDGHWGDMIENGTIRKILERLIAIGAERNDLSKS
jgi:hypothetical protein